MLKLRTSRPERKLTIAKRKRSEQHQQRTQQIVTTSAQLIQEKGFHGATLQEVADELDVTKAALYYYVKDKEELLFRIHQQTLEMALAALEITIQSDLPPPAKVRRFIDNQVRLIASRREFFTVYFHEKAHLAPEHSEIVTNLERQIVHALVAILREGIADGSFQEVDPTVAAFAVLGMSSWVYRWYRPERRLLIEEVSEILQKVILSGLERREMGRSEDSPHP